MKTNRHWAGIAALSAVVVLWISSSFLMRAIFADNDFNKPFMITYINTSSFSLYLIIKAIRYRLHNKSWRFWQQRNAGYASLPYSSSLDHEIHHHDRIPALTFPQIARLACEFCFLWFGANWASNASLAYTSVANSTILSSMSGLFTLIIGSLAHIEHFTLLKLGAVIISVVGVILITKSTLSESRDVSLITLLGDALALLGAIFYGVYSTFIKVRIGDESRIDMPLFFGLVGLCNVVLLWPAFPILSWLGIEPFMIPHGKVLCMVLVNALVGTFVSDYLWLLAVLLTSPLVVTLGMSLTIPFALFGDIVYKHVSLPFPYFVGAGLVVLGFIAVNWQSMNESIGGISEIG